MTNKCCILTIDTEGDNIWKVRNSKYSISKITTMNGKYLERFQILCEKYDLIPTYLVNYEMSLSKPFIEMTKYHRDNLEIGMHMHAWNNPPYYELSNRYGKNKSYIGEYPIEIQIKKVVCITKQLENVFECSIKSHRSGRWYIDPQYIQVLIDCGYNIDCTVTPGINWTYNNGQTEESRGIDFSKAPQKAYYMSGKNVCIKESKSNKNKMIEVPVSIIKKRVCISETLKYADFWKRGVRNEIFSWLRPNGKNLEEMKKIVSVKSAENEYVEFMIHSSELMPGGNSTFRTNDSIEALYKDLEELFSYIKIMGYEGISLSSFADRL